MLGETGVAKARRQWKERKLMPAARIPSANHLEANGRASKASDAPKQYKLTVAKGRVHMLRALRTREINGAAGSAHMRRMMRAQGRMPEARHPQGFSRWDEMQIS